jgi:hypothetical protein
MMPYQAYQLYQIERRKSRAEILRADEQLGRMAESVTARSLRGLRRQPATAPRHTARV